MSIKASIYHLTHYKYDKPVRLGPQIIRLKPASHSKTHVISHSLKVTPSNHFVNLQQDPYGNYLARYVFPDPVTEFKIEVDLVADMTVYNPFDFFVEETPKVAVRLSRRHQRRPEDLHAAGADGPALAAYVADARPHADAPSIWSSASTPACKQDIGYVIRMEPGVQTPEETLRLAKLGSCRDTSWLLVEILRHLGLAARFVSGYLIQLTPDLKALDGPSGTEVDFTDLHAWCEVYLPGAGWVGLDPTSGLLTGESHIPLAATPHFRNAAPISGGLFRPGQHRIRFRHEGVARRRASAHHQAVFRRKLGRAQRSAKGRRHPRSRGRAPDHGRRTDLRLDRRLRVRGMEHRRRRPDQARKSRRADPQAARTLRPRRLPALWPGQVVSGRKPAALDLLALLAQGRQADLAEPGADRR
jgi:transglutaminase-like putative cysteine protease